MPLLPALKVNSKKQALQELAARAATLSGQNERAIFDILMQREKLGSTAVGNGIAIPHGKMPNLTRLFGLFARLDRSVDFEALDGRRSISSSWCWRRQAPAPIISRRWRAWRACCATRPSPTSCAHRTTRKRCTPCWLCRRRLPLKQSQLSGCRY
jgi:hypothetical protein